MLKIEISFQNAKAAHKAAKLMDTMACPVPSMFCGSCLYKDACELLMQVNKVLKEVKDDDN